MSELVTMEQNIDRIQKIKQQMHERSMRSGELLHIGPVRGESDTSLWVGKTSVNKRISEGEITEADITRSLELLAQCYVTVVPGAPKRCVEDRSEAGYIDTDEVWLTKDLGPQLQGGTVDEAVARRLAVGAEAGDTLVEDVIRIASEEHLYRPGAHRGENAHGTATDCGSVDNEESKVALLIDDSAAPVVEAIVATVFDLVGKVVPADGFKSLQENAADLLVTAPGYFGNPEDAVACVEGACPEGVPSVAGQHKAVFAVLNLVPGETLNTNHFDALTDGNIYAFNEDVWNIFEENNDQVTMNILAATVTTLMRITDGSVRLVIRKPRNA